ncbi:hypothetical protein POM88_037437 [Heracleum sosnowskyi]|uniref:PB1-like domain-containing protein n=1 Tax=Heracleum sosnowskyi TaxID=360622 RepID=A0AAD8HQ86_9APIA|nr:hypothetical protein POM88_037437 [Heracleum sosnowskyi]
MRGRLRIVSDDNLKTTTWAEVPEDYWREVLEKDVEIPIIHVPPLTKGSEIPEYGDCSLNFTIKLAHGGEFDEKFESYVDGDTKYFDMCSLNNFHLMDLHSMCKELGIGEGSYDLWYCIPGRALDVEFVIPIDEEEDFASMLDMLVYSNCLSLYTTAKDVEGMYDFSYTQYEEDERVARVSEMYDECEKKTEVVEEEGKEEDEVSFHGDSSNMDSRESEAEITPKKRRNIPPPNPPFRLRRRGRYSMLRGLFKNTEDTPLILDDDNGPPMSQPSQDNAAMTESVNEAFKETGYDAENEEDHDTEKVEEAFEGESDDPCNQDESVQHGTMEFDDDSSEGEYNSDDERMAMSSCDEADIQYPEFNEFTDMDDPKFELEKKRQEEGVTAEAISKKVPKCTKCQEEGHNQRTCRSLVQKDEVQNKKQKVTATDANLKDNNERTKASPLTNTHSPKRTKQLARKTVRSSPLKHGVIVVPEAKNSGIVAVASHGGIVKPFKAPARVPFKTPLDVQPVRGQKYTSLKNLEAAKYEREKNKGNTKM